LKNLIVQVVTDVSQSPATAKAAPVIAAGLGWVVASEWFPVIGGVITFLVGLAVSITIVWTTIAQHRIKMKLFEKDLAEKTFREGRKDRRDD